MEIEIYWTFQNLYMIDEEYLSTTLNLEKIGKLENSRTLNSVLNEIGFPLDQPFNVALLGNQGEYIELIYALDHKGRIVFDQKKNNSNFKNMDAGQFIELFDFLGIPVEKLNNLKLFIWDEPGSGGGEPWYSLWEVIQTLSTVYAIFGPISSSRNSIIFQLMVRIPKTNANQMSRFIKSIEQRGIYDLERITTILDSKDHWKETHIERLFGSKLRRDFLEQMLLIFGYSKTITREEFVRLKEPQFSKSRKILKTALDSNYKN